jgi:hypothetical protein
VLADGGQASVFADTVCAGHVLCRSGLRVTVEGTFGQRYEQAGGGAEQGLALTHDKYLFGATLTHKPPELNCSDQASIPLPPERSVLAPTLTRAYTDRGVLYGLSTGENLRRKQIMIQARARAQSCILE